MEENILLDIFEDLNMEDGEYLPTTISKINKTARIDQADASELYFEQRARDDLLQSYYF